MMKVTIFPRKNLQFHQMGNLERLAEKHSIASSIMSGDRYIDDHRTAQ